MSPNSEPLNYPAQLFGASLVANDHPQNLPQSPGQLINKLFNKYVEKFRFVFSVLQGLLFHRSLVD